MVFILEKNTCYYDIGNRNDHPNEEEKNFFVYKKKGKYFRLIVKKKTNENKKHNVSMEKKR